MKLVACIRSEIWMGVSMARVITLYKWAESVFGEKPPHRHTLWKWIAEGKIRPIPKKIGRAYFCTPDAEYIDPYAEKRERILSGRSS